VAMLAVIAQGITGLAGFWVAWRLRIIGVCRALGATRGDILRYFDTENFPLATLGTAVGLAYGVSLLLMQHYEPPRLLLTHLIAGGIALRSIGQLTARGPTRCVAAVSPVLVTRSG
jgi:putative ABC transport system permease protein